MLSRTLAIARRPFARALSGGARPSTVALVGLGFGAEFLPIYDAHAGVEVAAVCQRNEESLAAIGERFGVERRYTRYEDVLADPGVDFVHINSPIGDHGTMSIAALKAGKHVMCTVPMATNLEECEEICALVKSTGLKYMMAETVVYSREFLYLKKLYEDGELGRIQYLAASHPQDMEGWPECESAAWCCACPSPPPLAPSLPSPPPSLCAPVMIALTTPAPLPTCRLRADWESMVPMHYATHAVSPVLGLLDGRAESVSCVGSGAVSEALAAKSGCSHAVQSAHIRIAGSDVAAHIWRTLFDTARQYRESFDVYGTKKSFEWSLVEGEPHVLHTAKVPEPEIPARVEVPDFAHLLPESIRKFTQSIDDPGHLSFVQGGGHGGSHPHMVHEMVSALAEERQPWPNAAQSANWTAVGILAHESAMNDGEIRRLPEFTLE